MLRHPPTPSSSPWYNHYEELSAAASVGDKTICEFFCNFCLITFVRPSAGIHTNGLMISLTRHANAESRLGLGDDETHLLARKYSPSKSSNARREDEIIKMHVKAAIKL